MRRAGAGTALLIATGAAVGAGCTPPSPPDYRDSVRVGTFNVQFLPGSDDVVARSARIAARILAGSYDIIALNEVFDEEAHDNFVTLLGPTFPYYVAYLGDAAVGSQDSGLMLFSRFPFEPLPRETHKADDAYLLASSAGSSWKQVAFIEYDADVFPDNWAAKGAAFVRIRNPSTSRSYNIAFTHMQASYPEDEEDLSEWLEPILARESQLDDLRRVILESLEPGQFDREDTFVLGDLNVDGDRADADLGGTSCCRPSLFEWVQRFDRPGGFFTDRMKDAWAFEHPRQDRGLTNHYHWGPPFAPETGARLDYLLRNRTTDSQNELCVQHLTLAHNMRDGAPFIESGLGMAGITELSDHIGLNADLNRRAPHCNPLEAWANPPLNLGLSGIVTNPGGMQWLRFDRPGTCAFVMQTAGFEYRVYQAADLSTPVPQYFGETTTFTTARGQTLTGQKFHLPEPPFFVRVFHSDRAATGNYQFVAHRHDCTGRTEACLLRASEPVTHDLPPTPINADDVVWFELRTEAALSGSSQDLRFRIRWETNLTILHGALAGVAGAVQMNLFCVEETDTIGIDEVYLTVIVDGITIVDDVYIGDFDDGVYRTLEDLIPVVRFLDTVVITLREDDGGLNFDDDFLSTTIHGLTAGLTADLARSSVLSSAGGKYLFRHNRSRSLPLAP